MKLTMLLKLKMFDISTYINCLYLVSVALVSALENDKAGVWIGLRFNPATADSKALQWTDNSSVTFNSWESDMPSSNHVTTLIKLFDRLSNIEDAT